MCSDNIHEAIEFSSEYFQEKECNEAVMQEIKDHD